MLGINCLLRNGQILPELRDIIRSAGYELAANGNRPSIQAVFGVLRKVGLEVDIQTTSLLYEDVFDTTDPIFSSVEELADARAETFRDLIDAEASELKLREIGKDNPVVQNVEKIMKSLQLVAGQIPTMQRTMQDRLAKAAQRVMKVKPEKQGERTSWDIIREVLQIEQPNDFAGLGNMETAETMWKEFQKEFNEMAGELEQKGDVYNAEKIRQYADILEDATYKFMLSTPETQKVIKDTLGEAGFTKEINTQAGPKKIIDWNKVITSNVDFKQTIKDIFGKKGFSEAETNRIADELESEFKEIKAAKMERALDLKNKDAKKQPPKNAVNRLLNLYQLGIFNNANQNALFKVLGVSGVTQARINRLQQLMTVFNQAQQLPVSSWSATYIRTIQREIEKIIEQSEEGQSGAINLIRKWGFYSQLSNTLLLSNPQNIAENVTSGIMQYLMTALTNPSAVRQAINVTADVLTDVAKGGVREGHELFNTFNSSGNLEDRYNFETAETPKEKIAAYAALIPRLALSSIDNSFKAGLVHTMGINALKKVLIRQGATAEEANLLINEGFYGNRAELESIAKDLEDNLRAMGIPAAKGKWKRMAAEMAWANMLSDGQFFHDTLDRLQKAGQVDKNLNPEINANLLKAIRNAAEGAASKGLGHQSDSWLLGLLDSVSRNLGDRVTTARQTGRGLASAEIMRNAYSAVNRYRPGSLRWWWLGFEKSSGLAFVQTLISDVILNKWLGKIPLNFNKIDLSDTNDNLQEELDKYMSLRQRLVRETVGPIIAYAIGNTVFAAVLSGFGGDDDSQGEKAQKLALWMLENNARKRWMQKLLPPQTYNYLTTLAWVDKYGKIHTKKIDEIKDPLDLRNLIATDNMIRNFVNNYSEASIVKLFDGLITAMGADKSVWPALGEFSGNFFNLGGPLKSYQIWKDAFIANPKMSKKEYDKIKPNDFWEGFLHQSLNSELYLKAQTENKPIKKK